MSSPTRTGSSSRRSESRRLCDSGRAHGRSGASRGGAAEAARAGGRTTALPLRIGAGQRGQDRQSRPRRAGGGHPGRRLRGPRGGSLRARRSVRRRVVVRLPLSASGTRSKGQTLGEIESVEAGQARGDYIAARAALAAAEANSVRERELADRQISSNREREVADAQAVSQKAKMRAALAHLRAIGFDPRWDPRAGAGRNRGRAHPDAGAHQRRGHQAHRHAGPVGRAIDGRVHDRGPVAALGVLDIYEKDLGRVHPGQRVSLRTDAAAGEVFEARVAYVDPVIDEKTRTAHVRVEFENGRKGSSASISSSPPVSSASRLRGRARARRAERRPPARGRQHHRVRQKRSGFEKRVIEAGASGGDMIEVRSGLKEGEEVAMAGAFLLKSELLR